MRIKPRYCHTFKAGSDYSDGWINWFWYIRIKDELVLGYLKEEFPVAGVGLERKKCEHRRAPALPVGP